MKSIVTFLAVSVLTGSAFFAGAVEVGEPAPPIEVASWLHEDQKMELAGDGKQIYMFAFLNGDPKEDRIYLMMLAGCQNKLKERNLNCAAFFGCDEPFVPEDPLVKNVNYPVGFDPGFEKLNNYFPAGQFQLPTLMIVDKDGTLIWRGSVSEMQRILIPVLDGTFDYKAADARLRMFLGIGELMQTQDYESVLTKVDEELKNYPGDEQLMAFKCYVCHTYLKDLPRALGMANEALKVHPESYDLYLLKLKLLEEDPDQKEAEATYEAMVIHLEKQPAHLLELAEALATQQVGVIRIDLALEAAKKCWSQVDTLRITERARTAAVLAKCYHLIGNLDKAIACQKLAIGYLGDDDPALLDAENTLNFYELARKLQEQETD